MLLSRVEPYRYGVKEVVIYLTRGCWGVEDWHLSSHERRGGYFVSLLLVGGGV